MKEERNHNNKKKEELASWERGTEQKNEADF